MAGLVRATLVLATRARAMQLFATGDPVPALGEQCRTAAPGDDCYEAVRWAKQKGIVDHPGWYPTLTKDSSFEQFQAFLHGLERLSGRCTRPCPEPPEARRAEHAARDLEARLQPEEPEPEPPAAEANDTHSDPEPAPQPQLEIVQRPEGPPPTPTAGGCYVWQPDGCPRKGLAPLQRWRHDVWGEDVASVAEYDATEAACERRKRHWDSFCGTNSTRTVLVDSSGKTQAEAAEVAEAAEAEPAPTEAPPTAPAARATLVPPAPGEPGCYVLLPRGCTNQPKLRVQNEWRRDVWGELNKDALRDAQKCQKRRVAFQAWCGVDYVVMSWVPAVPTNSSDEQPPAPVEPGCYVLLPRSGCSNQPKLRMQNSWRRDAWGEQNKDALKGEQTCQRRRVAIQAWCGADDVVMRWVPARG